MKRKRPSPPVSEVDFDISNALTGSIEEQNNFEIRPSNINASLTYDESESDGEADEAFIAAQQAASNRKSSNLKGRTVKKGGGFQAMGLNAALLKAITRKGFSVPTPIQRKTIPLVLEGQDVVGMARTGSGKTAAFVIPMIQRLKAHSAKFGARAIILSPSRELALQTLQVVKEMGRGTDLRSILLVGGDSLEEQFSAMTSNPDIIIATPGRFHHLKVEMKLDLSSVEYIVFDEADRLFEMGFAVQLTEILHGLPDSRQTLLFSATLPKSLVEFARAGLQEPKLIRLDAESKVSPDLENAFFHVKSASKEGALLQIIQDVIGIPTASGNVNKSEPAEEPLKKRRKKVSFNPNFESPSEHSTIVFAATKHRVDYLATLLGLAGYRVSYVYGALDHTARRLQVQDFRDGTSNILVVTDVAARGIDIPMLTNVINYDFPTQSKVFVHRVGRTARAGRKGWSYSLVQDADIPYLLDLQLFLSRRLIIGREKTATPPNFAEDVVVGALPQDRLSSSCEWVFKTIEEDADLYSLRDVAVKGDKQYNRTRNAASNESVKRAKEVQNNHALAELNQLFPEQEGHSLAADRDGMLAQLRNFRPLETVFEIGKRGVTDETVDMIKKARTILATKRKQIDKRDNSSASYNTPSQRISEKKTDLETDDTFDDESPDHITNIDGDSASEDELEVTFSHGNNRKQNSGPNPWQESDHFMSYTPRLTNSTDDKAYGVHSGSSSNAKNSSDFLVQARDATLDLAGDELRGFALPNRARQRWDKKSKKYVNVTNDEDGSRGARLIRGESGLKIAATLRSGRYDAWKKTNKIERIPRVGENEGSNKHGNHALSRKFKHKAEKAPKAADRYRDDYHTQKKKVDQAKEAHTAKYGAAAKNELRSVEDIRKQRNMKNKRQLRNGRPSKKGRG